MRMLTLAAVSVALAASLAAPAVARKPTAQEKADIETLAGHYIFAIDWRDPEAYAATFAPDGVLNYGGGQAVGREEIATVIRSLRERELANAEDGEETRGGGYNQHFVSNMVIDVAEDGNSATELAYWFAISGEDPAISSFGHYKDELVKIDGEWFYASRRTYNEQAEGRGTFHFFNPVTNPERYGAHVED
mgnify:CR=1 FL=1